MIHEMKLKKEYFDYIKNGTKIYEIRLNDEKRRLINIGDSIIFKKEPELIDTMTLEVVEKVYFNNFNELFDNIDISLLADKKVSVQELRDDLEKFYDIDKQNKYGVVAIKIKK